MISNRRVTPELVVRGFYDEFVNTGDLDAAARFLDERVEFYFGGQLVGTGIEAFQTMLRMLRTAFPDLRTTIEDLVAGPDKVCERVVSRGTHLGPLHLGGLPPIQPTGRSVAMHGLSMFHVPNDKITANWAMPDQLGLLHQLGALPASP